MPFRPTHTSISALVTWSGKAGRNVLAVLLSSACAVAIFAVGVWLEITLSGGSLGPPDATFSLAAFVFVSVLYGAPMGAVPFVAFVLPVVFFIERRGRGTIVYYLAGGAAAGLLIHVGAEALVSREISADWHLLFGRPLGGLELRTLRALFGGILPGAVAAAVFAGLTRRVNGMERSTSRPSKGGVENAKGVTPPAQ